MSCFRSFLVGGPCRVVNPDTAPPVETQNGQPETVDRFVRCARIATGSNAVYPVFVLRGRELLLTARGPALL
jgi:hypothetical protein